MKREYKLFLRDIVSQTEKIQEFVGDKDFDTFKRDEKRPSTPSAAPSKS